MEKVLLIIVMCIAIEVDILASRIKKDLTEDYATTINTLFDKNLEILEGLHTEAKIFSSQKDKLLQKNYYELPTGFLTQTNNFNIVVSGSNTVVDKNFMREMSDDSSDMASSFELKGSKKKAKHLVKKKEKTPYYGSTYGENRSSSIFTEYDKRGCSVVLERYSPKTRDILGVSTVNKDTYYIESTILLNPVLKLSFLLERNFGKIFPKKDRKQLLDPRDIVPKMIYTTLDNDIGDRISEKVIATIKKYQLLSTTLSNLHTGEIGFPNVKKMKYMNFMESFVLQGSMNTFFLSFTSKQGKKQQLYHDSEQLGKIFNKLIADGKVQKVPLPEHLPKKLQKNDMICIQSLQDIKYKGQICLNQPLDAKEGKMFKIGYFIPRDYTFIQKNKNLLEELVHNSKKIEELLVEYIKVTYLKSQNKDDSIKQQKTKEINLDQGL